MKQKEIGVMQTDFERFLEIMGGVDRHLKTLIKYLKNVAETSRDPLIIEHTLKQVKNIEKIHVDIRRSVDNKESYSQAYKAIDSMLQMPEDLGETMSTKMDAVTFLKGAYNEGAFRSQTNSERQSLEAAFKKIKIEMVEPSPSVKREKKAKSKKAEPIIVLKEAAIKVEQLCGLNTTLATSNDAATCHSDKKQIAAKLVKLTKRKSKEKENPTTAVRTSKRARASLFADAEI